MNRTVPLWTHRPPTFRIRRISLVCTVGPNQVMESTGGTLFVSTSSKASSGSGRRRLSVRRKWCPARTSSAKLWPVWLDRQPGNKTIQRPCWFKTPATSPSPPRLMRWSVIVSCQQPFEQRLLRVHAIAGLVENNAAWAVEDIAGNFLAAVGRQTMHEPGMRRRLGEQLGVHLEFGELLATQFALGLLTHARPNIGVDDVRLPDGVARHTVLNQLASLANPVE